MNNKNKNYKITKNILLLFIFLYFADAYLFDQ